MRAADAPRVLFTGQAGFVFTSAAGTSVGVDLYLTDCVERHDGFKRLCPKVARAEDLELDCVIATHWHLDHFDVDAMPLLMAGGRTRLVAAKDCRQHVERLHLDEGRVRYVEAGDTAACGDVMIRAVFCDHGDGAPLAVGVVLEVDGYKVYITGDTCLRLDKAGEIGAYGPFDIMIAPVNGAFGNLNEKECVELCKYHKPKVVIPCHYWMFAEQHGDPGIFAAEIRERLPGQKHCIMRPGEEIPIKRLLGTAGI